MTEENRWKLFVVFLMSLFVAILLVSIVALSSFYAFHPSISMSLLGWMSTQYSFPMIVFIFACPVILIVASSVAVTYEILTHRL